MQASTCIRESLYIEYHKLLNRNEKNLKKSKGEKYEYENRIGPWGLTCFNYWCKLFNSY